MGFSSVLRGAVGSAPLTRHVSWDAQDFYVVLWELTQHNANDVGTVV